MILMAPKCVVKVKLRAINSSKVLMWGYETHMERIFKRFEQGYKLKWDIKEN